jgi:hypothetical protein
MARDVEVKDIVKTDITIKVPGKLHIMANLSFFTFLINDIYKEIIN